jgi:hypothetical protein
VTALAENEKVERDYEEFAGKVEELAKAELERIKRRAAELKLEAEKVGEDVEASIAEAESASDKKKS